MLVLSGHFLYTLSFQPWSRPTHTLSVLTDTDLTDFTDLNGSQ